MSEKTYDYKEIILGPIFANNPNRLAGTRHLFRAAVPGA